jgi:Tfp pilus assembly protein FimT
MTISAGRDGRRFASIGCAGYSVTELVVVCAVIGLLAVMTIPFFVTYYQAAAARASSQQVVALLNQARGLAVKENDSICVQLPSATQMRMRLTGCGGGAIWVGPGTDALGMMTLPQGFTLAAPGDVVFSYLGAALPATTFTLTNSTTGATTTISVALTGRVTSP